MFACPRNLLSRWSSDYTSRRIGDQPRKFMNFIVFMTLGAAESGKGMPSVTNLIFEIPGRLRVQTIKRLSALTIGDEKGDKHKCRNATLDA